jgi:D-amino acid aminotransferase
MDAYIIFNGQIIESTVPCLKATDRGFLLGDGVFETLRAYNGALPFWDLHLERLRNGMAHLGFSLGPLPFDQMKEQTMALLVKNGLSDAYVRVTVSRGDAVSALLPEWGEGEPNWVIFTKTLPPRLQILHKKGVKAVFSSLRRNHSSPTARFKTVNYLNLLLAKREAVLRGADEALLLDEQGHVAEAATSNIFWIKAGTIYTPSVDLPILPGVTRQKVLDMAKDLGISAQEGAYAPEALTGSSEAFLTNSLCEIIPLISIEKSMVGDGIPGPMTRKLQSAYRILIHNTCLLT